ncbi:MAG: prolyl-tRNA synthetase associated domain-containing protein [Candidatus Peregrinibacteria bacterium]|nr:prolyl-tRNA synthetase associated domain-containing protein [Candidatus Peregrinibacteria bacterium]
MSEQKLYNLLKELEIPFEKVEHEAFFTCEASGDFYSSHDLGVDCKNIFLRDKRGRKHFLVVLPADKQIDIPALAEHLGEHRKMGFASDERLLKFLGLTPGSVTPFGLIHENATEVKVIVDEDIFAHDFVHFHPLRNTATLKISTADFRKYLDHLPNEIVEFKF